MGPSSWRKPRRANTSRKHARKYWTESAGVFPCWPMASCTCVMRSSFWHSTRVTRNETAIFPRHQESQTVHQRIGLIEASAIRHRWRVSGHAFRLIHLHARPSSRTLSEESVEVRSLPGGGQRLTKTDPESAEWPTTRFRQLEFCLFEGFG